jgi:uncharacterized protein YdhG (YjbR/CyaY superfamily)
MVDEIGDDLRPYAQGKGTLRFPAGDPIPTDLVRRIMRIRLEEVREELAESRSPGGKT